MGAARKFKSHSTDAQWRSKAYAAININWTKMRLGDREDRLAWIEGFLQMKPGSLQSTKDLTDDQLGAVTGELKRLMGLGPGAGPRRGFLQPRPGNVVAGDFGRDREGGPGDDHQTVHLASPEQVHTLVKIKRHLQWKDHDLSQFLVGRKFGSAEARMLTFRRATDAVNALLHVAAHRDLKVRNGLDKPVGRAEINKYIPLLKQQLQIDQRK